MKQNWEKEIEKAHQEQFDKVYENIDDSLTDSIEKAVGHKYFKREGVPGSYKYYYTEAEYREAKGQKTEKKEKVSYSDFRNKISDAKKQFGDYGSEKTMKAGIILNYIRDYPVKNMKVNGNTVIVDFGGDYKKKIGALSNTLTFSDSTKANNYANIVNHLSENKK